ncbi:gamma-glutamyl-gamma-aminobutyrate hydrolase family protein [Pseudalkalibacillus caeni]|uniref:Gamma-glutamyl-gamma-aminobutyrate hydrolase family protein n=1 Tax=Exobacillus caeni TaxID=2574798 RepID=A0A5R9EZP4_9BACL|nr:gamma-glutamyl-gamma-aminobutyrate hydrolase family protein [Pseudalkalibacillus caeni]TLS35590.1 gamma-glutamyl-gamma-aminobutyrate hydrolase family protein [Pseudalkalibacillus caeni]
MQPIIGVTAPIIENRVSLHTDNMDSIVGAGAIPFIVPYTEQEELLTQIIQQIDGLFLTGGVDIDPTFFGEEPIPGLGEVRPERDKLETLLIHKALEANKPIFAICRGIQMLNVAAGGNMYQDIYSQVESPLLQHAQKAPRDHLSHFIKVKEKSLLEKIAGKLSFKVNSFHHQAVKDPAPGFSVSATASDGVVEAIESMKHRFVLGVQWHPENLVKNDSISRKIFGAFVEACRQKD